MKKKKILLITDGFPYVNRESFLETELQYLTNVFEVAIVSSLKPLEIKRQLDPRIQVHLYAPAKKSIRVAMSCIALFPYLFSHEGMEEIIDILKSRKLLIKRLFNSLLFFAESEGFYRWLIKEKLLPDNQESLCYFYWNNHKALSLARRKSKYPLVKMVSRLHNYDLYNERRTDGRQPFKKFMDSKLDKIMFLSNTGIDYYMRTFGIAKSPKHIISPLGTENKLGPAPYQMNNVLDLVSCSHVIPIKRVHLIIDALALVGHIDIHWQHFGGGVAFEQIIAYAKEKLSDKTNIRYTLHGAVPNKAILHFYRTNKVDCFMTTSAAEGNPVSIMEALSFGIPIIATAVGGIPEMLHETDNILLPGNPKAQEIEEALYHLFDMDCYRTATLRSQCVQVWEKHFMASKNYGSLVNILNQM